MRLIDLIVVHCSDSDNPKHDDWRVIKRWHLERGFHDIGYHFVIQKDGGIRVGRPLRHAGAHAKGHNRNSIGICLTGKHEFTESQFESLKKLCDNLIEEFGLERQDVVPHRSLNPKKTCPNFNVGDHI